MSRELEYKTDECVLLYEKKRLKSKEYISILGFKEDYKCEDLIIPKEIDGLPVKCIDTYAFAGECIKTVNFPDGLTIIENSAFCECNELTKVVFPSSLREIREEAFDCCSHLKNVKFNEGLEYIESNAFVNTGINKLLLPDSLIEIGDLAFQDCELTSVKCGSGLKIIGDCAFCGNEKLVKVEFNEGLEKIHSAAFDSCGLVSAVLPDSLTTLEFNAFDRCENLELVYIGANVTNKNYTRTFALFCPSLKNISVSKDNKQFKSIDNVLYDVENNELIRTNSNIKKLTIPKWVESISPECFFDIFPEKVTVKAESLNYIEESYLENAKTLVCIPDSKVEEWANDYADIEVVHYISQLDDFLDSLSEPGDFLDLISEDNEEK